MADDVNEIMDQMEQEDRRKSRARAAESERYWKEGDAKQRRRRQAEQEKSARLRAEGERIARESGIREALEQLAKRRGASVQTGLNNKRHPFLWVR
jgi:hypothetical protein